MSAENLPKIVSQLVGHGRPVDTPVAVVRWGTWTEQETVVGTLADIVSKVVQRNIGSPAVAVIGETVRLREVLAWFPERQPAPERHCAAS